MRERRIIPIKSFKILQFPVLILIILWISKIIFENILGVGSYRNVFNLGILTLTIIVIIALLYIFKKRTVKITKFEKEELEIRCSPLILWITAILLTFVGCLGILGGFSLYYKYGVIGFIPGILFFGMGIIAWFESLTNKIVVTKDGIIFKVHKIFPFPGIYYPFNNLTKIKMRGKVINLKHKQTFLGAKRFFIFDSPTFIKEIEKYAPSKLDKN